MLFVTKGNTMTTQAYQISIVGVPSRSWKWGHRCEVRVHRIGVDPKGRGYHERCEAVYGDYDARYRGARSALGQKLAELRADWGIK